MTSSTLEVLADKSTSDLSDERVANKTTYHLWILNPVLDILLCCGGLLWIVVGIHCLTVGSGIAKPEFGTGPGAQWLWVLVTLGTYVSTAPHSAATLARIYQSDKSQRQFFFYSRVLPFAYIALAIGAWNSPAVLATIATVSFLWNIQHWVSQSYGVSLIYCYKRSYRLNKLEQRVFWLLMNAMTMFVVIRHFTYKTWNFNYVGIDLPFYGVIPPWVLSGWYALLALCCILFAGVLVRKAVKDNQLFPFPALLVILTTAALVWALSRKGVPDLWMYGVIFFHGAQYLAVTTSYFLKERSVTINSTTVWSALSSSKCLCYLGLLFMIGVFMYLGIPSLFWHLKFDYIRVSAIAVIIYNLQHFATDFAIWRMKDPETRKLLVS